MNHNLKTRGRAEKSRLKKESVLNENPAAIAAGVRAAMARAKEKELSAGGGKKVKVSTALANKSHPKHKQAKGIIQRIKDRAKSMLGKSKKKKAEPKKQSKSDANFYARQFGGTSESVNEAMSESQRFKVYNSLKRGDIVSIKYDSSIQKGSKYIPYVVTKGKTKLMKGKIERIILKSPKNPRFKAYLYNRDGDVSLALGDMAASIVTI